MFLFLNASKLLLLSHDACVLKFYELFKRNMLSWWYFWFKVDFFLCEEFMIERSSFLYFLLILNVTKNILKYKTLKSLLLDALKVMLFFVCFIKFHFVLLEDKNICKGPNFLRYETF